MKAFKRTLDLIQYIWTDVLPLAGTAKLCEYEDFAAHEPTKIKFH